MLQEFVYIAFEPLFLLRPDPVADQWILLEELIKDAVTNRSATPIQ